MAAPRAPGTRLTTGCIRSAFSAVVSGVVGLEEAGQDTTVVGERDEADAQPPLLAACHAAHFGHRALEALGEAPRLLEEVCALGRELDAAARACEQRHAEPLLKA